MDVLPDGQGFTPLGADEPLPSPAGEEQVTADDTRRAAALWDRLMPSWAGLLDAQVTTEPAG